LHAGKLATRQQSKSGLPACPIYPLEPIGPPGKLVPFRTTQPSPQALPFLGLRLLGTLAGVFTPLSTGNERTPGLEFDPVYSRPLSEPTNDRKITLYRGVPLGHPMYTAAQEGMAIHLGFLDGHKDPYRHILGDTYSIFTSWSVSPVVALRFAYSGSTIAPGKPGGIVLEQTFSLSQLIFAPGFDPYNEGEFLIIGVVVGCKRHSLMGIGSANNQK